MTSEQRKAPKQLSLGIAQQDEARFSNYIVGDEGNAEAVQALLNTASISGPGHVMLWGSHGVGLTHLLQGMCHECMSQSVTVQYLPLSELLAFDPYSLFEGLEQQQVLCLDGIELCAGNPDWERALFHLYNNVRDAGHITVMSSHASPAELGVNLPDLKSRILSGAVYHIRPLSDDTKRQALILRAASRGMELSADVANFILTRAPRDTSLLFTLLNTLDEVSLEEQRKLTIPFVRSVMERSN